jgi:DNA-binding protein YbaB
MPETYPDASTARRAVRSQVDAARARAATVHDLTAQLAGLTTTVTSPRNEVTVSADARGTITTVTVNDDAFSYSAADLSTLITRTVLDAQRRAAETVIDRASQTLGADDPFVARLRADLTSRDADG